MSPSPTYREVLQQLTSLSHKLPKRHSQQKSASTPLSVHAIPQLRLTTFTDEFKSKLALANMHPKITDFVISKITQLEALYQQSFLEGCRALSLHENVLPSDRIRKLRRTYEHLFQSTGLSRLFQKALDANTAIRLPSTPQTAVNNRERKLFNHNFTPILEKYFDRNPYPSPSDRQTLAHETNMTLRQIEVWFQNHRNRAKKDGKVLKRETKSILSPSDSPVPPFPLFDTFQENREEEIVELPPIPCPLLAARDAPPHAFPAPYPSASESDPFPRTNGKFVFLTPPWYRSPAKKSSLLDVSEIDMEQLIDEFAEKLNFRVHGGSRRRSRSVSPEFTSTSEPWHCAITVIPYPAPLPSLLPVHASSESRRKSKPLPLRRPRQPSQPCLNTFSSSRSRSSTPSTCSSRSVSCSSVASSLSCSPLPLPSPQIFQEQIPKGLVPGALDISPTLWDFESYSTSFSDLKHHTTNFDNLFSSYLQYPIVLR